MEPVTAEGRALARAVLSTLTPELAACVLAFLANFARAIVDAFASATLPPIAANNAQASISDALEALDHMRRGRRDGSAAAYAIASAWWFATPHEVDRAFGIGDRFTCATVASQARGALLEVEALRAELGERRAPTSEESIEKALAHVLVVTPSNERGYVEAASGLAEITADVLDVEGGAALAAALVQVASVDVIKATKDVHSSNMLTHLRCAIPALDVARRVALATAEALEAAPYDAPVNSVMVRAA